MKKKFTAILILTAFLINTYAVSAQETDISENNEIEVQSDKTQETPKTYTDTAEDVYTASYLLSDGLTYKRTVSYSDSYGAERGFVLEYTPSGSTEIGFASGEYLYQTGRIKDLAEKSYPDKNFAAGINADFFNMSTGVPESAFIKDYELYTTDRDSFCLAEREDGTFFIDKPSISLKMLDDYGTEYTVLHLNKEFTEYGLYIYTDKYSPTTHINSRYTAVTLLPYEEKVQFDDISEILGDEEVSEKYSEYSNEDAVEGNPEQIKNEFVELVEKNSDYRLIGEMFYLIKDVSPQIGKSEKLVVSQVDFECSNSVIPSNAYYLCADNTSYGYILMAMQNGDTFEFEIDGNESFFDVKNAIGTGTVILKDGEAIDDRTFSHYTSLQPRSAVGIKEDGTLVLYAADGRQKNYSSGLKLLDLADVMKSLGCVYAANLDGGGSTAVSVSLPGYDEAATVNSPSGGSERKVSNAVVFLNELEADGIPAAAYSYSDYYLTLSDWYSELNELTYSDINGFSANAGADFDSDDEIDGEPENENDSDTDDVDYKDEISAALYTKDGVSTVEDGRVFPNGYVGEIEVYASLGDETSENIAAVVKSIENPDAITVTLDKYEIAPFESVQIKIESFYKKLNVSSDFSSFGWSADLNENYESEQSNDASEICEDENSNAEATENDEDSEIYGTFENGVFSPAVSGTELVISAERGELRESVVLKVNGYPFADIENHWAVKEIYALEKLGVVNGQLDEDGVPYYLPQRSYSRYEFCAMLARITGIGSELEVPDRRKDELDLSEEDETVYEIIFDDEFSYIDGEFEQLSGTSYEFDLADAEEIPDWAYEYVYRMYVSGFLDDILLKDENGNDVFNGSEYITREDVMLVLGRLCEDAPDDFSVDEFYDLEENLKSNRFVKNVIYAGIFSGYEDMSVRPMNFLTRAEAAAVFVRLLSQIN